ncbi:MAG: TetR/AcrR family transcriptional regulator [Eggerthellaceae bacterium]|jgi:AcrR family transcriptional regulator
MGKVSPQAIQQAAFDLTAKQGSAAVTMQELARVLGVKAPSLYAHVNSLASVKAGVAIEALDRLNQVLVEAALGKAGVDAGYAVGWGYRQWALAHPLLYQAIMAAPALGCDYDQIVAANKRVGMTVRRALGSFCATYGDALDAERYLRSLVNGYVSYELAGFFAEDARSTDDSFDAALRHALSWYATQPQHAVSDSLLEYPPMENAPSADRERG